MFDFGSTLLEGNLDPIKGNVAVLKESYNPKGITAEQLQIEADKLDREILNSKRTTLLESTTTAFQNLLYDLHKIKVKGTSFEKELLFWDAAVTLKPTEGIESLLKCLHEKGIICSIISNLTFSGAIIAHELQKHDLLGYFQNINCSSDYGFRKPSKRIFEVALLKDDCCPQDVWFIGDSIETDVQGALDAGMNPILYNQNGKQIVERKDIVQIHNWRELEERIRKEL